MQKLQRIVIIKQDKCKPKKCQSQCKKVCPVNKQKKKCISIDMNHTAHIVQQLCIGCGHCAQRCPFKALHIVNIPTDIYKQFVHRYHMNGFKLHKLPVPRKGQILGLIGSNGLGKSTILNILSMRFLPNLNNFLKQPTYKQILDLHKGSTLYQYLSLLYKKEINPVLKPQHIEKAYNNEQSLVEEIIQLVNQKQIDSIFFFVQKLKIKQLLKRKVKDLSGGQMQKFAILLLCLKKSKAYLIDEPSSFLDIQSRLSLSQILNTLVTSQTYIILVQHDLCLLDYLSTYISILYGVSNAFGVVSMPYNVKEGINMFLQGFLKGESIQFRKEGIKFKMKQDNEDIKEEIQYYQEFTKKLGGFCLYAQKGFYKKGKVNVLLGKNGTGKTTFIRALAGKFPQIKTHKLRVSYKAQSIAGKYEGSVKDFFQQKNVCLSLQFKQTIYKTLQIKEIEQNFVSQLSGGQLQKLSILLALYQDADIYLFDQPSAYLDVEQRIIISRLIKNYITRKQKYAFVVQHDFTMATYLADELLIFEGEAGKACKVTGTKNLQQGMNYFLKMQNITFRRDPQNYRLRINKLQSVCDRQQKKMGKYYSDQQ